MKFIGTTFLGLLLLGAAMPQALQAAGGNGSAALTILHSFGTFPNGANPQAALVLGKDGNFYGTTANGGVNGGNGTVFRLTPRGVFTSLYSFTGGNDGANPSAALAQGRDGYFYGVTAGGGAKGANGTVFRITPVGVLTTLYSFKGGADGSGPNSLTAGSDGALYGTTPGTIFRITPAGALKTLAVISGASKLVEGRDGYFYGTSSPDGGNGTVFKMTSAGAIITLYSFTGGEDGGGPTGLAQGSNGVFYGATAWAWGGVEGSWGNGTVFKITPRGAFATLCSFTNGSFAPSTLTPGGDGNLYGTAQGGGDFYEGTFFRITPSGAFTTLCSFSGDASPGSALVLGNDGNFYATTAGPVYAFPIPVFTTPTRATSAGKQSNRASIAGKSIAFASGLNTTTSGCIFKLTPGGRFSKVYSFTGFDDGGSPQSILKGSDGNFYGTATRGGLSQLSSASVFKTTTNGAFSILYSFPGGENYISGLTLAQGNDGSFYGTEFVSSPYFDFWDHGEGSAFKITSGGQFTNLYSLQYPGAYFVGALTQGSDGNFYGTEAGGYTDTGIYGFDADTPIPRPVEYGFEPPTIFRLTTNGGFTSLYSFTHGIDDSGPSAALAQGRDGNFYGTCPSVGGNNNGTIFQITPDGAFTSLYSFTNGDDGAGPVAALALGNDGNFYGSTPNGGSNNQGAIFKVTTNGILTSLYSFTNGVDGANPQSALALGSDGNFYGFTPGGGAHEAGAIFQITPNGAFTILYSFAGGNGGAGVNSLAQGNDGNFYGTTANGGAGGIGTLFRLSIPLVPIVTRTQPGRLNEPSGSVLTLSATVNGMPPLSCQWQLNGVNLSDGGAISGSTGSVLAINPLLPANSGTYRLIASNFYGAVTSAVTALTVTADTVAPTVVISSPAPNALATNGTISGTAADNARVVAVDYWLINNNNGVTGVAGEAVLGPGTTSRTWTIPGAAFAGSNIVMAQSVDFSGNKSRVVSNAFFHEVPSLFALTRAGNGAVAGTAFIRGTLPPTNGAMLNVGESYTLAATPAPNWWFTNWTSGDAVVSTNPILRFVMENGAAIQANFVTNLFNQAVGNTYNGLFYGVTNGAPNISEESAGMISGLTVNTKGIFSGRLSVNGVSCPMSGAFDHGGRAAAAIPRSGAAGGNLAVSLDLSGLWDTSASVRGIKGRVAVASYVYFPPQPIYPTNSPIPLIVFGPVNVTGWTNTLFLFASTTNRASAEYTMLLPPDANQTGQPPGTGYVLITNHAGTLTCNGALADGAGVFQVMPANEDGFAPLFVNLYTNTGLLMGWLNVAANPADAGDFDAAVSNGAGIAWTKQSSGGLGWELVFPDGFTRSLVPGLSIWTNQPIPSPASSRLEIAGGPLGTNSLIFTNLQIGAREALTATTVGGLKLRGSYSPSTGLLKITALPLGIGAEIGAGAVALLQTTNAGAGAGFFTSGTNAGSILLRR